MQWDSVSMIVGDSRYPLGFYLKVNEEVLSKDERSVQYTQYQLNEA